jgi:hypothetical protein
VCLKTRRSKKLVDSKEDGASGQNKGLRDLCKSLDVVRKLKAVWRYKTHLLNLLRKSLGGRPLEGSGSPKREEGGGWY